MQRCCKESIMAISQRRRVFRGGDSFAVRSHSPFTCVEDDKAPSVGHCASECTLITCERVGAWTAPLRWPFTPSFSAANASLPRISSSTRVYGQAPGHPDSIYWETEWYRRRDLVSKNWYWRLQQGCRERRKGRRLIEGRKKIPKVMIWDRRSQPTL